MTIEEDLRGVGAGDISDRESLAGIIRALASQTEAAEQRSRQLAERVALLERADDDGEGGASSPSRRRPPSQSGVRGSDNGSSPLKTVEGVPEDDDGDDVEALADRVLFLERRVECYDEEKNDPLDDTNYSLPESTFSLLITESVTSVPFVFAAFTVILSVACLVLTLASSISGPGVNPLGMPAGVAWTTRFAQFLGEGCDKYISYCTSHDIDGAEILLQV